MTVSCLKKRLYSIHGSEYKGRKAYTWLKNRHQYEDESMHARTHRTSQVIVLTKKYLMTSIHNNHVIY